MKREYRIKIVPNDNPNAEGEWRDAFLPDGITITEQTSFKDAADIFSRIIPDGYHVVSYEKVKR